MELSATDRRILAAVAQGLPLAPRPFAEIGAALNLAEDEVVARVSALVAAGLVKRFGVVVHHRALGYGANAMVVWDIPDEMVSQVGQRMAAAPFVTLCYLRPRRPPHWRYNLFCMIHGRERAAVAAQVERLAAELSLPDVAREILFSRRCFKQRGADYAAPSRALEAAE